MDAIFSTLSMVHGKGFVMRHKKLSCTITILAAALALGCSDNGQLTSPELGSMPDTNGSSSAASVAADSARSQKGATVANGWYEEEEIYYINNGIEEGVTERGENQIYLIGGDREWQAQVVLFIPGEPGYSPHWNVNLVNTAAGVTVDDIVASPYVSTHYPEALFGDVEDILAAEAAGLVTITKPGAVVHCPIVPEKVADAPGNIELSEDFPRPWPETF